MLQCYNQFYKFEGNLLHAILLNIYTFILVLLVNLCEWWKVWIISASKQQIDRLNYSCHFPLSDPYSYLHTIHTLMHIWVYNLFRIYCSSQRLFGKKSWFHKKKNIFFKCFLKSLLYMNLFLDFHWCEWNDSLIW